MFHLFSRRHQHDAKKQDTPCNKQDKSNIRFRSHSFSTNAALATILCQPCRINAADGRMVCKI